MMITIEILHFLKTVSTASILVGTANQSQRPLRHAHQNASIMPAEATDHVSNNLGRAKSLGASPNATQRRASPAYAESSAGEQQVAHKRAMPQEPSRLPDEIMPDLQSALRTPECV
jgi:hypothetical protein